MEMFFAAWKGYIISACLLLGCWENNTILSLRSGMSIGPLISVKFADTFNGTIFFFWDYLLRLFFPFSPVHCCASRAACCFVNQTGEIEIVWVKGKKKKKR